MQRESEEDREEKKKNNMNELLLVSTAMEGYTYRDSVTPPLSQFSPAITTSFDDKVQISRKRSIRSIVEMENIHKERNRRVKLTEMYSVLQHLVPNLRHKATRETIVTETIEYIQRLEEEKRRLENLKKSILRKSMSSQFTNRNSSVNVSLTGNVAFFGIQVASRRRLVSNIIEVFERHRADVLAVNVSVNDQRQLTLSVTAAVGGNVDGDVIENIKRDILIL